jgi:hypothetical protein
VDAESPNEDDILYWNYDNGAWEGKSLEQLISDEEISLDDLYDVDLSKLEVTEYSAHSSKSKLKP